MNTKTKSTLVLISVLLIGIIIGALGSSLIRRNIWQDRLSRLRSPEGFSERLIHIIQPDTQQEEQIRQILLKHHEKMEQITEQSRSMIKAHADSLLIDLKPLLTADQLDRLKEMLHRRPPHYRDRREPPPPPPDNSQ
jgi:hypothetical protein